MQEQLDEIQTLPVTFCMRMRELRTGVPASTELLNDLVLFEPYLSLRILLTGSRLTPSHPHGMRPARRVIVFPRSLESD